MTQPLIELDHVHLSYQIYTIRAQSLRNAVMNLAVGGRLLRDSHDIIHVNALEGVSFSLDEGDRLGIMGHNGSGKTTLLKVLAGIYEPTHGTITVRGNLSSMLDIGLGLDFEGTGIDNIKTLARIRGLGSKEIKAAIPEIVEFSDLGAYVNLPLKTYSSGMFMRLLFAIATSFQPDILILDEWLGAGDEHFVAKATSRMTSFVGRSRAVVIASHSRSLINDFCNKVLVLHHGRVAYFGPLEGVPAELPI
jgi:lipopolysaccharide transport system ATP-binding protein